MTRPLSHRLHQFVLISWVCALLSLIGALIAQGSAAMKEAVDPTIPQQSNFYQYTFARFEPFSLYLDAAFFLVLSFLLMRQSPAMPTLTRCLTSRQFPLFAALVVFILTGVGRFAVHQNFDLCIDEYLNEFEVRILDQHHLVATLPEEWRDDETALKLPYVQYNEDTGSWASGFLPGFASLDFLFDSVGLGWALSPVLAALSILLVARLAERAFPDQGALATGIAVLLLTFSPQFLAMATTKFAWTAHLCGTLFWVWLFTHPKRLLFLFTPLIGVMLIGLHQPHVHLLVAVPFLLRLIYTRDWKALGWFGSCYLAGAWAWYQVMLILRPVSHGQVGDLHDFSFPFILSLVITTFHALTLLAWCTPVIVPLVFLQVWTWKTQPPLIRDCFVAAIVTFLFYLSFPHEQGHGWGYRYMQSVYGLLALAATGGAVILIREGWSSAALKAVLASVIFSAVIQIPYRIQEIHAMVTPLSLASRYIESQRSDFVVVQTSEFWYSWDLIRNDPWLKEKPLIFDGAKLSPAQLAALGKQGSVTIIGAKDVKSFGVILSDPAKTHIPP